LGEAIAGDDFARLAYGRLQKGGFDLHLVERAPVILSDGRIAVTYGETLYEGDVEINVSAVKTLQRAKAVLAHESKHVDLFIRTGSMDGTRGVGEYLARAREFLYVHGRRPNALEREAIINLVREYGYMHR